MNGAQAILESLKKENVDVVFGYPGGAVLTLYDAVYKMKFRHILTRHEQGAVHAADGYARATGKVGVVFATSGPGATNLITGISTAYTDSIPLVCITGQVGVNSIGKDAFQEADIFGITTPITKHNYLVKDVHDLPRVLKEAFFIARTGRPGPVVIDIAKNVFDTKFDYEYPAEVHLRGYSGNYIGKEEDIDAVVEAIGKAKRPVLMLGGGVISSDTSSTARQVAEILGAPITCTLMGIGSVPADMKGFLGFAGMHGSYAANMTIQESDLLICLGMRFSDRVTGKVSGFAPQAKIVHFDIDQAEIHKIVKADYPVIGDLRWSLPLLEQKLRATGKDYVSAYADWCDQAIAMHKETPFSWKDEGDVIKPGALVEKISDLVDKDTIAVTDVGQHQMWAAQFFKVYKPRHFLTSGGQGTMGYGLPASIGAKIGCPNNQVILFTGDGSIMMNCQEFATMASNHLNVKTFVIHNCILGMVGQWQRLFYNHHYSQVDLEDDPTDLCKLAEAMGVKGYRLTKKEELESKLPEILQEDGPALIDVWVPKEENVFPMVPGGHTLDQMVLGGGN